MNNIFFIDYKFYIIMNINLMKIKTINCTFYFEILALYLYLRPTGIIIIIDHYYIKPKCF